MCRLLFLRNNSSPFSLSSNSCSHSLFTKQRRTSVADREWRVSEICGQREAKKSSAFLYMREARLGSVQPRSTVVQSIKDEKSFFLARLTLAYVLRVGHRLILLLVLQFHYINIILQLFFFVVSGCSILGILPRFPFVGQHWLLAQSNDGYGLREKKRRGKERKGGLSRLRRHSPVTAQV